jgi:methanethiol S-methyltransferase
MDAIDMNQYLILSLLITAWCTIHSAMITILVTEYLKKTLGPYFRFYRLFYNIISILTLIPVALYAYSIQTQGIVKWDGYMRICQATLIGIAVLFFYLGGLHYDAGQLLGTRQIKERSANRVITDTGQLDTSGALGMTRHPWYFSTMLIIWARQMDISAILVNAIFTFYLIVGTWLEEKKLIREFGGQYIAYQKEVSMLIPFKWIKSKISGLHQEKGS